jgi:hypothetical protein
MAPALMNGLRGMPRSVSSCTSELNGLPEGSRPMRCHSASPCARIASVSENTLEMLWMEKGTALSPACATSPAQVRRAMPNWCGDTRASAGM